MYQSLLNFFNFVVSNLVDPLANSISDSGVISTILDFFEYFLKGFFRLWNNENDALTGFDFTNLSSLIAQVCAVLFIILIVKLSISIVNVFISTIKGVLR